jgi:enterochelin esterase-like enzyme
MGIKDRIYGRVKLLRAIIIRFHGYFSLVAGILAFTFSLDATAGTVLSRSFTSAALNRSWSYSVYLPSGYETSNLRYPVLYLLLGYGDERNEWVSDGRVQQTADALIASGDIPPCLIVMPDGGTSWYIDRKEKMETAFIQDLLPDVEKTWRALSMRSGRLVGGFSMGGYGALRFALKYPDMFAAAALLSPAIYNPEPPKNSAARRAGVFASPDFDLAVWKEYNYPALWDAYLAKRVPIPMYINSGDDDQFFIEHEAETLYHLLRVNDQPAELRIVDGGHNWSVWGPTLGEAIKYVFRWAERPAPSAGAH